MPHRIPMRAYVPDMTEFFAWMDQSGHAYVVLRGFEEFKQGYPAHGAKEDVDLLVADAAILAIKEKYGNVSKRRGVKCDIYNVSGEGEGSFLGHAYYPPALSEKTLSSRRLWNNKFYVPDAEHHLLTLLYHVTYHKAERSKIDRTDSVKSLASKYIGELAALKKELNLTLPDTLTAYHRYLKEANYNMPYSHFAGSLQNDFAQHVKSYHMASVVAEEKGELNMFVIRHIALKKQLGHALLAEMEKHYTILAIKPIPWMTRQLTANQMRGGKWKRGGKPCLCVIVYDPHPQPADAENQKIHPYVFNVRQNFKRALREWFTKEAGTNPKSNPIHSTDNEAEALGHLNLFFTPEEQAELIARVTELRRVS